MEKVKVSDPMRLFTFVVSALFVVIGVTAIVSGNSDGWLIAGFFGLCLLVAVFEPWFSKPWVTCDYRLVITNDEIACEHPKRQRESIRWADVNRIWYVTTSEGPRLPDEWLILEGENGGLFVPHRGNRLQEHLGSVETAVRRVRLWAHHSGWNQRRQASVLGAVAVIMDQFTPQVTQEDVERVL